MNKVFVAAALAVIASLGACQPPAADGAKQEAKQQAGAANERRAAASKTYASLLTDLDKRISALQARADSRKGDWLIRSNLASELVERAGLTNDLNDFARVQKVLDETFAIAPGRTGPVMVAARFNYSIHRLDVAESYLDMADQRVLQKTEDIASGQLLRAQIAMQRGQYDDASAMLSDLAEVLPSARTELALYLSKTGDPDHAEQLLEQSLAETKQNDPRLRAWTRLQLGIIAMDHGRYEQALERFEAADAELPGWWLVNEHIAQIHSLLGETDKAIAIYKEIVERGGLPQEMDRLAHCYDHAGNKDDAAALSARAGATWKEHIALFPEAAMGHGLDHYLQYGAPDEALELAKKNLAVRPNGEAQVAFARALLKASKADEALSVVDGVLATPYRTAGLYDVAAQAHTALKQPTAAEEALTHLVEINPRYRGGEHMH